jgi:hypothetical protein
MTQGAPILFRVIAGNQIGFQTVYSGPSSGAVIVQTAPVGTPADLVLDATGTGKTQLSVLMTSIADSDIAKNGGSPITSYSLEWD